MNGRVPLNYYLLTGLTGFAIASLLSVWVRQLSLIFGIHTSSVIVILIAALLCMYLGSAVSGRLSQRISEPLLYSVCFSLIVVLFVIFQNFIFEQLETILQHINLRVQPRTFRTGFFRFIFSLSFFLIPLSLLTASFPMYFRFFIKNIYYSGIFMSATLISLCFSTLLAILITSLFLVPQFGVHSVVLSSVAVLILLTIVGIIIKSRRKDVNMNVSSSVYLRKSSNLRFRKKKNVLEISTKLTRAMLTGSVFHAFSFTAMLLTSYRILVKYNYTTSVLFFTIITVITLVGIITGSLSYKRTVDRPANKFLTLATLQVLSGFTALICYSLFHLAASGLLKNMTGSANIIIKQSSFFAILLFIPSAIYGLSFPLAARLYPKRIQQTGRNFAKLICLVLFSIIAALVVTPYFLIPLAGIEMSFILLSLIMLLSGVYLILKDSRLIRVFRVGYGFSVIILFLLLIVFIYIVDIRQISKKSSSVIEGSTSSVSFTEQQGNKQLYLNNVYYLGTDEDGLKEQVLAAAIPAVMVPDMDSVLVIGFGTGITPSMLDQLDISVLDITEVYPEIVKLSSNIYSNENSDILTGPRTNIYVEDVRSYLFRKNCNYDLITMGSDQISLFSGRYTTDFYKLCKTKLSDSGVLCQIVPLKNSNQYELYNILKTTASEFGYNTLWYVSNDKMMLLSSTEKLRIDFCTLTKQFSRLNRNSQLSNIGIDDPLNLAGHLILSENQITALTKNATKITDDRPYNNSVFFENYKQDFFNGIETLPSMENIVDYSEGCSLDSADATNRVRQVSRSLLRQASQTSLKERPRIVDFDALNGSLFLQYL